MRRVWLMMGLIMLFAVALLLSFSTWTAKPVATKVEERTVEVSVLFLDIAGYTELSEQLDSRQLNHLVQAYFSTFLETIRTHHGHVSETAGDGLVVIFPAGPKTPAHALNATRAALVIYQQTAALNEEFGMVRSPIQLHVGINSGEALVGATKVGGPSGQRWTFKATGPTVNIAARLAAFAGPGEIIVGETTAEEIRSEFVLKDLGEKRLDNVTLPVRVYRLILPGVYEKVVQVRSPGICETRGAGGPSDFQNASPIARNYLAESTQFQWTSLPLQISPLASRPPSALVGFLARAVDKD